MEDSVTITGDSNKGGVMKLGVVVFLGLISAGCSLFQQPVIQESYFVPVIRSDNSSSGYTPTVTPMSQQRREQPRIYTPVLR
ncbi:hypothetical protein DFP80_109179 [Marinomonas rhizomae]|uniref:Uncharacterized protein n=2 Tax=Marinomonas rhizomae TaxID=491948 RepID=A0A366J6A3_9GAMM|nr:hypothetical protein DFP80_109179 [Marinomonas rhizomae]